MFKRFIVKIFKRRIVKRSPRRRVAILQYLKYKEVARGIVHRKLEEFNKIYNFKYNKISIKNQKTRWGSCSRSGNINFNYKIALLSDRLADYIIVHELCHLGEFNHSKNFWNLVEKTIPDYEQRREELRKKGYELAWHDRWKVYTIDVEVRSLRTRGMAKCVCIGLWFFTSHFSASQPRYILHFSPFPSILILTSNSSSSLPGTSLRHVSTFLAPAHILWPVCFLYRI